MAFINVEEIITKQIEVTCEQERQPFIKSETHLTIRFDRARLWEEHITEQNDSQSDNNSLLPMEKDIGIKRLTLLRFKPSWNDSGIFEQCVIDRIENLILCTSRSRIANRFALMIVTAVCLFIAFVH
jgi:hypothetical protein